MKLKTFIKKILNEYIDPRSIPFEHQAIFSPIVTWYLTPHAYARMEDERNLSPITMDEINDATERATKQLLLIVADKRNNFKPGPGFSFIIVDKNNEYLQLGCKVDYYDTLSRMDVNIMTLLKSGTFLRKQGFVNVGESGQLKIYI
jgi:hypothetical protein